MFADSSCNQKYPEIFGIFLKTKNYQDINNATYDKLREKLIWDPLVDVQLIKAKFFYKWCFSYKPDLFYTISWAFSENFYFKMRKAVHYDLFSQNFVKKLCTLVSYQLCSSWDSITNSDFLFHV